MLISKVDCVFSSNSYLEIETLKWNNDPLKLYVSDPIIAIETETFFLSLQDLFLYLPELTIESSSVKGCE